ALTGRVHVYHGPDYTVPPRFAPAVVTVHDLSYVTRPQDAHPAQRRFLERAVPASIHRSRLVVAVSESTKRDLIAHYRVPPERIRVIPNAAPDWFGPVTDEAILARTRRRLDLPARFILSVGTIQPRKNLGALAAAAASLNRTRQKPIAVIHAGREGWLCGDVYRAVEAASPGAVRFIGHPDDATLQALYTLATVCAFPSFAEGFGLPILEAFACDCPVVTSRAPGTAEVAGDAALLADPQDPAALAEALTAIIDSPDLAGSLRAKGRRRRRDFSWRRSAQAMLEVYREAASGHP
ncbi:MAG: glycosyltransferase family 4 protein, partial [Actinobacteria bacterium]|nr:glycosyltransferase family 4 protein [Actinomycetota bacterium]